MRRRRREDVSLPDFQKPRSPEEIKLRANTLKSYRAKHQEDLDKAKSRLAQVDADLALAPKVEAGLDLLSSQMFDDLLLKIGEKLSFALRDVMAQDIELVPKIDKRGGIAQVDFSIRRDGKSENLLRGQGGSVVNVLSVGMRMFALASLDPKTHRQTLFLDEPDAWLSPDLVPRLMKVVSLAAKELGFQVVVISHHDLSLLREGAQKVIEFVPQPDGSIKQKLLVDEDPEITEDPAPTGSLELDFPSE